MSVVIAHTSNNFGELRTMPAHLALLNAVALDAQSAVSLFFVLSGFLITYLLLQERRRTGTVLVSKFYVRRALRIWPLYYLVAATGFLLLRVLGPAYALYFPSPSQVILVVLLLPNFAGPLGPLGHLWSIGLEEQFYLAWPWVVKRGSGFFLRVVLGILIVKIGLAPVIPAFHSDAMAQLFTSLRFECMAIGALGAYAYYRNHRLLAVVYSPLAQALVLACLLFLALVDIPLTTAGTVLVSIVSIVLILNVSTNERSWLKLEHPLLNTLGRMSYGIYMYHFPLLYTVLFLLRQWPWPESHWSYRLVLYGMTVVGTLALAAVSYRWFEAPFLGWKERFAVIRSRR